MEALHRHSVQWTCPERPGLLQSDEIATQRDPRQSRLNCSLFRLLGAENRKIVSGEGGQIRSNSTVLMSYHPLRSSLSVWAKFATKSFSALCSPLVPQLATRIWICGNGTRSLAAAGSAHAAFEAAPNVRCFRCMSCTCTCACTFHMRL